MRIAIIGATGFVGRALIRRLLDTTDYQLVAFSRSAHQHFDGTAVDRLIAIDGDLFNKQSLATALQGCDAAVYLVHMMTSTDGDYAEKEAQAATLFVAAANQANIQRIVYLGGLGDSDTDLSKHLASRQRSGKIIRRSHPSAIELRASMVIGDGSAAYEILKAIARKLPILAVPRWTLTPTQPITLDNTLDYVQAALTVKTPSSIVIGIGGPEVMTYRQVLGRYTTWAGHRQHVFAVPGVPRWAAAWWLRHFLPTKSGTIGKAMVDSLHHPMVVKDTRAAELFPAIKPQVIERGFTAQ